MFHGPSQELDQDNAVAKKTRIGVILFWLYLLVYAGFVVVGVCFPEWMSYQIFGQSMSVVYGMGLILLAIIMGGIYHICCTKYEEDLNERGANE